MTLPILYSFRRCPYAMRARLAIFASEQQVELREVVLRDKPEHMIEISPKATVPVLYLLDGSVIEESFEIMEWALNLADPNQIDPERFRVKARVLVERCDVEFKPYLDRYKYPNKFDDMTREAAIAKAADFINDLDKMLENQQFLMGHSRGFSDIGIAPFIRQFAHVDRDWFLKQPWKNVIDWYLEFTNWDGFLRIMSKYPKWTPDSKITVFPEITQISVTAF
ncbi:stringent starvation protein A [Amylibacter kogurei]|uniref:Stringent starvation protein A n=1 Tax=Paramylibacter kogurei TaxID=1889778 RepID=A0A2G5K159_9RHOB|nr:glutathione S-transferase [Amylibacter kogurei]PIB23165.1 stringent starvation protein A [Amylibacter kogurei]